MSDKATVTERVRVTGIVTAPPRGFGSSTAGVSVILESQGRPIGIVVTDDSIPVALSLHVGQRVTCYGTFFAWPGKEVDELWGSIQPYVSTSTEEKAA